MGNGVVFGTAPMNCVRHAWPEPPLLRIFKPLRSLCALSGLLVLYQLK